MSLFIRLGSYVGRSIAEEQKLFQVIAQHPSVPGVSNVPEVVVLQIYGDYFLTAPFDRTTKEVERKLYILKISDMPKIPLTLEKVGPLRVKR